LPGTLDETVTFTPGVLYIILEWLKQILVQRILDGRSALTTGFD
jgi:hypothetical protein